MKKTGKKSQKIGGNNIGPRIARVASSFMMTCAVVSIAACSATGQRFQSSLSTATEGDSKIIVYRVSQFVGGGYTADIMLDGKAMGRLKNGGYITASVAPGRHVIEIDKAFFEVGGRHPTLLDTISGQVYFVRYNQNGNVISTGVSLIPVVRDGFSVVPQAQALHELESLNESK